MLSKIVEGRTDLVFDFVEAGNSASAADEGGVSLLQWCAYYGDVSAMKFLLAHGAPLDLLGDNYGLNSAAFHGHWQLCQFLLEQGANANHPSEDSAETPLHAAICKRDWPETSRVVRVLLAHGADPNLKTKPGVITGGFMRDCRTKGESALHRAAAFGDEVTIKLLLDAGATIDAKDANGDSPLGWASWYLRPNSILRLLLYGEYRIHPENVGMKESLVGRPQV